MKLRGDRHSASRCGSHPARGAWIEIPRFRNSFAKYRRTPQGVRGLKYSLPRTEKRSYSSHPARGAWIEILLIYSAIVIPPRRTPQGVRGLKFRKPAPVSRRRCRTPQGVRGLKFAIAGIEDEVSCRTPQGVRGLKCCVRMKHSHLCRSHPARGAWIEITASSAIVITLISVAPRKGCVD